MGIKNIIKLLGGFPPSHAGVADLFIHHQFVGSALTSKKLEHKNQYARLYFTPWREQSLLAKS